MTVIDAGVKGSDAYVVDETMASKPRAACVTRHRLNDDADIRLEAGTGEVTFTAVLPLTGPIQFTKYNLYTDSLRHGQDMIERGIQLQEELKDTTFEDLLAEQTEYLNTYWKSADVVIQNDDQLQEGIRFNLFQLPQSAGRDKHSNISAKGLSGEGYEGHYFWDTEIYMFPVFLMTQPDIARQCRCIAIPRWSRRETEPGKWGTGKAHCSRGARSRERNAPPSSLRERRNTISAQISPTAIFSIISPSRTGIFSCPTGRGADRNRPPLGRHRALL